MTILSSDQVQLAKDALRNHLPDDTGGTQLGLLALADFDTLRNALVTAAVPLEVIVSQINEKPYTELSHNLQVEIIGAVGTIRSALRIPEPTLQDNDGIIDHLDIDDHACDDEDKEYFDCSSCSNNEHVFKFVLGESGDLTLSTYFKNKIGFWSRVKSAFNYVFAKRSEGIWESVTMDQEAIGRLHRITNKALCKKVA